MVLVYIPNISPDYPIPPGAADAVINLILGEVGESLTFHDSNEESAVSKMADRVPHETNDISRQNAAFIHGGRESGVVFRRVDAVVD